MAMKMNLATGEMVFYEDALDIAIRLSEYGKPWVWTTSSGAEYRVKEMEKSHLINVLNLCGRRFRIRLRNKATRLFAKSALPAYAAESERMVAKAHYHMSVAQNAAAVYERVTAIPILKRMVRALREEHGVEYTWQDMRENVPQYDGSDPNIVAKLNRDRVARGMAPIPTKSLTDRIEEVIGGAPRRAFTGAAANALRVDEDPEDRALDRVVDLDGW
jgi:hypothetical protein